MSHVRTVLEAHREVPGLVALVVKDFWRAAS
jgi:hypothetical protein